MGSRRYTTAEALRVGDALGVDWDRLDVEAFRQAMDEAASAPPAPAAAAPDLGDDEMLAGRLAVRRLSSGRG